MVSVGGRAGPTRRLLLKLLVLLLLLGVLGDDNDDTFVRANTRTDDDDDDQGATTTTMGEEGRLDCWLACVMMLGVWARKRPVRQGKRQSTPRQLFWGEG